MPAAIEITKGSHTSTCAVKPSQTSRIICGFTASSQMRFPATAAALSLNTGTPKSCTKDSAVAAKGSATAMLAALCPRLSRPPISERAILPPPINAIVWPWQNIESIFVESMIHAPNLQRASVPRGLGGALGLAEWRWLRSPAPMSMQPG